MISKSELEEYAKRKGIKNLGFAELDYFQNLLLFIIYRNSANEVIFKGGTALYKCFGLDRFSEDLDFDILGDFDFKRIEKGLKDFGLEYELKEKKFERSLKIIVRIKGPLFVGTKNSFCRLELDFSLREKIERPVLTKKIGRFIEEIPSFEVLVMSPEEILSEKFRACLTRNKARDVYDIYFLINEGIKVNKELINGKLKYYSKKYNKKEFSKSLNEKKKIWKTEMGPLLYNAMPSFEEVIKFIEKQL